MDSVTAYLIIIISCMVFTRDVDSAANRDYWKPWRPGSDVPQDAVAGDKHRYVGRVNTFNGQITAMISEKRKVAVAIHDRKVVYTEGIEILCSNNPKNLYWTPVNWKELPHGVLDNAFLAGFQKDIGSYLYVGRVKRSRMYKIGKVVAPKKEGSGLWIWQGDKPVHVTKFQLLRSNNTK